MKLTTLVRDDITYLYFQDKSRRSASSDTDKSTPDRLIYNINTPVHHVTPNPSSPSPVTFEEDRKNERLIHAMKLLLAARERVLSLSEQRVGVFFSLLLISDIFLF
jgi:hypothetical protein